MCTYYACDAFLVHLIQSCLLDCKLVNIVLCNLICLVVTVDGILLTKSGTMTGGTSGGMEARSKQWDDKKIEGFYHFF